MSKSLIKQILNKKIVFPKSKNDLEFLRAWSKGESSGDKTCGDDAFKVYMSIFNTCSEFSEQVLDQVDMLTSHNNIIYDMQEEYQPHYPPMSPVTNTFFYSWYILDLLIGESENCLASLFNRYISNKGKMKYIRQPLNKMMESYCNFYEVTHVNKEKAYLWDILHKKEISCECKSGHKGKAGEIWYVRLFPPLREGGNWVTFNTPYVFKNTGRKHWEDFFGRIGSNMGAHEMEMYLKYGNSYNYWLEFVFQAYSGYTGNAIFSEGVPDIVESRPHGRLEKGILTT